MAEIKVCVMRVSVRCRKVLLECTVSVLSVFVWVVSFVYRYQIEEKSRKYFPSPQLLFTWSPTQKYPHIQNALERHKYIHKHRYTNTRKPLQENHPRLKTLGLFIKVSSSNIFSCCMLKSPMASGQSV